MSAFDRLGNQTDVLTNIEQNTASMAVGGALYDRIDTLVTAITEIKEGKTKSGGSDIKQALALAIVAPSIEKVGMGLQYVVDAINNLQGSGKEIKEKMEAITGGLVIMGDVGKSILLFAGYMVLAIPALMLAAVASPIIGLTLFAVTTAVIMATKNVTEENMKKLENLHKVGLGILAIMASLALSSLIIVPALKGALAATLIIGFLGALFYIIPEKALDGMQKAADSLLMLGLGILAVVVTFALTSLIIVPALKGAVIAGLLIGILGLVFYGLEKLGAIDAMEGAGKSLLMIAGAILGLGIALALFNIITPPMTVLFTIAMVVGAVGLIFGLLGTFGKPIERGAKAMLWAALSIVVLGLALALFNAVIGTISGEEAVKSLGALLLLGLLGAAFYLAGTQAPVIAMGAGAMILVGVAVIVLALGVKILFKSIEGLSLEQVGMGALLIGGLGLAFGAAGFAAPFIAAGAGAFILVGGALMAVGGGMMILKKLDFGAMTKGNGILGDSGQKTNPGKLARLFGAKPRPKTNMEVMFEAIGDSLSISPLKVAAMAFGAPALIAAGVALTSIAMGIRQFEKIAGRTDLDALGTNVNLIVAALADNFARIGREYPGGGTGIMGALFGGGGGSVVAQGISAVSGMGRALTGIAKGVQSMANLKFPTGFDKDGNPTGFETIDVGTVVPGLIANTKLLVAGLSDAFAQVGESKAAQGGGWFSSNAYEKGIKVVKKMGEPLANLAMGVQNMANLKFPTGYDKDGNATGYKSIGSVKELIPKLTKNTKDLIIGLSQVFQEIGQGDAQTSSWWQGSTTFEKGIKVAAALGEPYKNLADTIKNVEKVMNVDFDQEKLYMKTAAIVSAILMLGMQDASAYYDLDDTADYIENVSGSYKNMARQVPKITDAINAYDPEKGDMFSKHVLSLTGGPNATVVDMTSRTLLWKQIGMSSTATAEAFPSITEAVNDMDLAKVTETRKMFEALAVLAEGGEPADILAEMGESLEEALQNLADMLGEFKSSVGEGMAATAESGGLVSGAIGKLTSFMGGGSSASSGGDGGAAVVSAVRQLHKALTSSGIKIKNLDDLA